MFHVKRGRWFVAVEQDNRWGQIKLYRRPKGDHRLALVATLDGWMVATILIAWVILGVTLGVYYG